MNVNYTVQRLLRKVWVAGGTESYPLTYQQLAQQMAGGDGESVITLNMCRPPRAVVVCPLLGVDLP
jgi:hypothetical protein